MMIKLGLSTSLLYILLLVFIPGWNGIHLAALALAVGLLVAGYFKQEGARHAAR